MAHLKEDRVACQKFVFVLIANSKNSFLSVCVERHHTAFMILFTQLNVYKSVTSLCIL